MPFADPYEEELDEDEVEEEEYDDEEFEDGYGGKFEGY